MCVYVFVVEIVSVPFSWGYMHVYGMTVQDSLGAAQSGFLTLFPPPLSLQKTSLLMVLKPPPPPPPPDGPQLPGGLLSSEPLGLNEQEDEGAWRAWVRALSSCSYWEEVFQRQITYRWTIKHTLNLRYVKDLPMLLRCSIWLTHSINTAPSSGDLLQLHTGKSTLHSSMTHEITPCILQQDSSDLASNSVKKKKKVLCGLGYQWRYGLLSLNFFPPDRILYSPQLLW